MTKLKTLKDLDVAEGSAWLIRQEAIKWVKTIRSDKWNTIYHSNPLFMKFFKITKEELKKQEKK